LSNVGNVDEMAENALKILSTDENLQRFRINALTRAKDFTLEKILPMYETLYESVLK
jgi:glycosyltransferase involved in cell wall biosynthesis